MAKVKLDDLKVIVNSEITRIWFQGERALYWCQESECRDWIPLANKYAKAAQNLRKALEDAIAVSNESSSFEFLKWPCSYYDMAFQISVDDATGTPVFCRDVRIPDVYK